MSELTVVCTDRGAHKVFVLARLRAFRRDDGEVTVQSLGRMAHKRARDGEYMVQPSTSGSVRRIGAAWEFVCPACGRNTRRRDVWLAQAADFPEDAEPVMEFGTPGVWRVADLDVSHLTP